ncbi:actin-related protein 2/3 complex subunit 2B isoform X2 [Syzygium oleosum]|uniref:actin-related protein 2/3 complex subunit 2B isoform X2 n=1 Tax=Syzygium oleosum TaxID=219896 RepID=UPI0024BA6FAD|nr:actin-related protein 2/3 complex subunit 2B isoform X2 [Syzygium oleosum]
MSWNLCIQRERERQREGMACFDRASPALKETLLKIYRAKKPTEMDQHLFEFGAVEYHIKCSASDPQYVHLSISTPLLSQEVSLAQGISQGTVQMIKGIHSDMVELIEPATEGYQLTLRLNFDKIPQGKESSKIITELAGIQAAILSCQLKEMLSNVASQDTSQGMYKPIKLVYHPREPFFVVKQPKKTAAVFPMRFQENTDVIIATAFFQELMDVGSSEAWAKVPLCTWSPIPPPELRGEQMEDLSTNCGFVSFDILPHHVKGKRLDKTVWNLLNFYAFVKYHVKCTRGFIQRRMRKRLDNLVKILHMASSEEGGHVDDAQGCGCIKSFVSVSKTNTLRRKCRNFTKKVKRMRSPIKIHGFRRFRRRWLTVPKFSSAFKYTKLD